MGDQVVTPGRDKADLSNREALADPEQHGISDDVLWLWTGEEVHIEIAGYRGYCGRTKSGNKRYIDGEVGDMEESRSRHGAAWTNGTHAGFEPATGNHGADGFDHCRSSWSVEAGEMLRNQQANFSNGHWRAAFGIDRHRNSVPVVRSVRAARGTITER